MNKISKPFCGFTTALASIILLAGCGTNVNGTYNTKVTVDVPYGESVLKLDHYYSLTLDGNNYDFILSVDITGGFATTIGYDGTCTIEEDIVTFKDVKHYYTYSSKILTDDNGNKTLEIDYDTKSEAEIPEGFDVTADGKWKIDVENKTMSAVK